MTGAPRSTTGASSTTWPAIDAHEKSAGRAARRPRVKLTDVETMRAVAAGS